LGRLDGEILKRGSRPSRSKEEAPVILDEIAKAIHDLNDYARSKDIKVSAVGMGTPGSVDVMTGFLKGSTPNFSNWQEVPIKTELEKRVDLPVFVDNDANLMALGEAKFGAGIGHKNIICLTIGTGIGGGIILNGELFRGSYFAGAELGHTTIKYDGMKCGCGGKGCLEKYASATAMIDQFYKKSINQNRKINRENINVKYIFTQMKSGNAIASEVVDDSTYFLGRGIANFMNIFNPTVIIIGGGVAEAGKTYLKKIETVAFTYAMECAKENVEIIGATLGNKAGYMGAISFALNQI
jgi:glucokinase